VSGNFHRHFFWYAGPHGVSQSRPPKVVDEDSAIATFEGCFFF
jgi:hypothetical protein